jgi:hypothetical protein
VSSDRIHFAGPALGFAALGLPDAEPLFRPEAHLVATVGPRAELRRERDGRIQGRFPLPGTPDHLGGLTGRPGGLGTGWVRFTTFESPAWRHLWHARLTAPRSVSLAEREWNLLCALRAAGVGTPEPLVVGTRGLGPVARRSFLVVRELEGAVALPRWLRPDGLGGEPGERERGLDALAATLANLLRSRILLPHLAPDHVRVSPSSGGDCEHDGDTGPRRNRLPGISIDRVTGGRTTGSQGACRERIVSLLDGLDGLLDGSELERLRRGPAHESALRGPRSRPAS